MTPTAYREQVPGERVAFLVGAGRSGTTLLYKLLCLHPQVAFISHYGSRFSAFPDGWVCRAMAGHMDAKLRAWFNQGGNAYFINRPWLKRFVPTPHEAETVFARCGIPLVPAPDEVPSARAADMLRRRFDTVLRQSGAAVFLSKRTANNRRIRQLSAVFPAARYVHLLRDGRDVAHSLSAVEWWNEHMVWWDGRTPVEMEHSGEPRLAICARNWVRELEELQAQLAAVDPSQVLELRFEDLLCDPQTHLDRVLRFLGADESPDYRAAIDSLGLRPVRARWGSDWTAGQVACVLREARPMLRKLGYTN